MTRKNHLKIHPFRPAILEVVFPRNPNPTLPANEETYQVIS